jgi:hypothetical protein
MPHREDEPPINPFTILGFEADIVNLYGDQGPVTTDGDPGRISHEDAAALEQDIRAELTPYVQTVQQKALFSETMDEVRKVVPPEELVRRYDAGLQAGVLALAEGTLHGRGVSAFTVITSVLDGGWYENKKHVSLANDSLRHKAEVAHKLVDAVALLEHNFPPYASGYRRDTLFGLWDLPRYATDYLNRAYKVTRKNPGLFGDEDTTLEIMEGVADRLELHRPTFMGTLVGREPFPRFDDDLE